MSGVRQWQKENTESRQANFHIRSISSDDVSYVDSDDEIHNRRRHDHDGDHAAGDVAIDGDENDVTVVNGKERKLMEQQRHNGGNGHAWQLGHFWTSNDAKEVEEEMEKDELRFSLKGAKEQLSLETCNDHITMKEQGKVGSKVVVSPFEEVDEAGVTPWSGKQVVKKPKDLFASVAAVSKATDKPSSPLSSSSSSPSRRRNSRARRPGQLRRSTSLFRYLSYELNMNKSDALKDDDFESGVHSLAALSSISQDKHGQEKSVTDSSERHNREIPSLTLNTPPRRSRSDTLENITFNGASVTPEQRKNRNQNAISSTMNGAQTVSFVSPQSRLLTKEELHRQHVLKHVQIGGEDVRRSVYNFYQVPFCMEKFLSFGFLVCLDAFLFYFTFLPLRIMYNLMRMIFLGEFSRIDNSFICDVLKGAAMIVNLVLVIQVFNYSYVYHMIRGEAALKLYVVFNMLEVFDKLLAPIGQDIQDAMFFSCNMHQFSTKFPNSKGGMNTKREVFANLLQAPFSIFAHQIYLFIHTLVQFFRVAAIDVALNSSNNALITLLISTNFVELRKEVFKKYGRDNTFLVTCADVVERFQLFIFCFCIVLKNAKATSIVEVELFWIVFVFVAEIVVDAIKHAFIAKFNKINSKLYTKFKAKICEDLTNNRHFDSFLDNTSLVSRRLGFVPLPLISIVVLVVAQTFSVIFPFSTRAGHIVSVSLFYLCLFSIKILLSITIVGHAIKRANQGDMENEMETESE